MSENVKKKELTPVAIAMGIIIGVIMTAANVYLGLYAGMTVSASIPAAVIAMGIFKGVLKKNALLESNIVQTMASAGESLAAGVIFTLPALVMVGAWQNFKFWETSLIAAAGGLLGVIFMIPLRRALIVEDEELTYPEGVACAAVLRTGTQESGSNGFKYIIKGLMIGGAFKFAAQGLKIFKGEVATAFFSGNRTWFFGMDASPALMAVGYIISLKIAVLVFIGGVIGWFVAIPMFGMTESIAGLGAVDAAWTLWSTQVRYLGVGAMLVGGIWSIISVRHGIIKGVRELKNAVGTAEGGKVARTERNLSPFAMLTVFLINFVVIFFIYKSLIGSMGLTLLTTFAMIIGSFLFVAVSSYIVGLVGSSNNPVSGMTISALLGTASLFLVLGFEGDSAILATLGVAAVVCCAACTAADCSQDLKTGHLVGATPRSQQIAQIIGVVIPAFVIGPVLGLLHSAYGIGTGLKAPQASLFASITNALFGKGTLPYEMVAMGAVLGVIILVADSILKKKGSSFRLYLMPLAVGIYLPVTLAVPIVIGGFIRYIVEKKNGGETDESKDGGVLMGSGLIAGEAVMGIVMAVLISLKLNSVIAMGLPVEVTTYLTLACFAGVIWYLYKVAMKSLKE